MKNFMRVIALVVGLGAVAAWLATGAHRGWTKTSVEEKITDEVTGIEGIAYENHFVPGIDFLGAALVGAGALAGISFLFRSKPKPTIPN